MPPKGEPKAGKRNERKMEAMLNAMKTDDLPKETILELVFKIKEEIAKERENKLYFLNEANKIKVYWAITLKDLEAARAKLRLRNRQAQNPEENEAKIVEMRQKMKNHRKELQEDHFNNVLANVDLSAKAADDFREQLRQLHKDRTELLQAADANTFNNEMKARIMTVATCEDVNKERNNLNHLVREIKTKFEKEYEMTKNNLITEHTKEVKTVEDRLKTDIRQLLERHKEHFTSMKTYYNDVVVNNLVLITELKSQLETRREENDKKYTELQSLRKQQTALTEPLKTAKEEAEEYRKVLFGFNKDRVALETSKIKLKELTDEVTQMRWVKDVLEQRYDKAASQLGFLKDLKRRRILDVISGASLFNLMLQKKAVLLEDTLLTKDILILEYMKETGVEKSLLGQRFSGTLSKQKEQMKDILYELAKVSKERDELIDTYHSKMHDHGMDQHLLGFIPLVTVEKDMDKKRRKLLQKN